MLSSEEIVGLMSAFGGEVDFLKVEKKDKE